MGGGWELVESDLTKALVEADEVILQPGMHRGHGIVIRGRQAEQVLTSLQVCGLVPGETGIAVDPVLQA